MMQTSKKPLQWVKVCCLHQTCKYNNYTEEAELTATVRSVIPVDRYTETGRRGEREREKRRGRGERERRERERKEEGEGRKER